MVIAKKLQQIIAEFGVDITAQLTRPESQFGDFASNVALQLAGKLGRNPREIAEEIATKLRESEQFSDVSVAGSGFINIRLSDAMLYELARSNFTAHNSQSTVVIETYNPNPFKAMHIGHALNAVTADTIANLLDSSGAKVYRVSYHGDVGLHVGKSMYALLRYTNGRLERLLDIPEAERNSFMSKMYAEGAKAYKEDESAKPEIDELAKQSFTRQDKQYASVYDTIFEWSFQEIVKVIKRLGCKPAERRFLESEADSRGVEIVRNNTPAVFQESDGAIIFKGSDYGSFDNVFVSSNGMGLYGARDIGLMHLKNEQYHADKSYIVTAEEQKDYFKGVIVAGGLVWPEHKGQTINIPTGTVKLSTGKMSSRDGQVVEIAWLFDRVAEAVKNRGGQSNEAVVAGAIRYAFLKVRVGSDIVFDINEAVSIQGNSGPYLQYAHARACSILEKAQQQANEAEPESLSLDEEERALLRKVGEFGEVLERAVSELLPHHICTYLYELAQEFNRFYEKSRIIGDDRQDVRLELVTLYRDTLVRGLEVLGIATPQRM